ncbi:MAG: cell wall hydrolase [Proteobacteria bacterium]|nr:cell wall hydrolase [Pseudomonadota bacterium]
MTNNITEADLMILARTIYGEARGELSKPGGGMQSLEAVAWVVKNRALQKRFGKSISNVCLQPWQFSCWNQSDPNRPKLLSTNFDDKIFQTCFLAATNVVFGNVADCTFGADHYHSLHVNPYWSKNAAPTAQIANHLFYKLG